MERRVFKGPWATIVVQAANFLSQDLSGEGRKGVFRLIIDSYRAEEKWDERPRFFERYGQRHATLIVEE